LSSQNPTDISYSTDTDRTDTETIDAADLFGVLENERRQCVIRAIAEEDRTHSELATMLAHAESPDSDVDHKLRKSVYVCLYQTHLGALESHDIITWDQQSGLVTPGGNHGLALQVLRSVVSAPEVSDGAPRLNPDAMADSAYWALCKLIRQHDPRFNPDAMADSEVDR